MDINNILTNEAINALVLVFPRRTVELVQRAVNEMVSRAEINAGEQLDALDFADMLRHVNLRRPMAEEAMRADGIVPVWEQPEAKPDPDPLKGAKPRLRVAPQREPGSES